MVDSNLANGFRNSSLTSDDAVNIGNTLTSKTQSSRCIPVTRNLPCDTVNGLSTGLSVV